MIVFSPRRNISTPSGENIGHREKFLSRELSVKVVSQWKEAVESGRERIHLNSVRTYSALFLIEKINYAA